MTVYSKSMMDALAEVRDLQEDNMDLMRKAAGGAMQTIKMKDGKLQMDSFTASAIMKVYDKVNPANQKKMAKMINDGKKSGIMKLQDFAMKQVKSEYEPQEESRQLKDPKKEVMVVKGNKVVVIDKKDEKKYLQKGYKLAEASGDKEAYTKFFNSALKKFKVNSPAELKGDAKKKFYDYVDKNWEGDNEKAEAAMAQVREFKIQGMKAALASIWNVKEGKNPFKVEDDKKVKSKDEKTMTGKKAAIIDLKPKIKD